MVILFVLPTVTKTFRNKISDIKPQNSFLNENLVVDNQATALELFPKVRHVIEVGNETAAIVGNTTLVGQTLVGCWGIKEGCCALVDGTFCPVPGVNYAYYAGGALQIVGGTILAGTALTGSLATPAGWLPFGVGFAIKKVGDKIVDYTNFVNPAPALSKIG